MSGRGAAEGRRVGPPTKAGKRGRSPACYRSYQRSSRRADLNLWDQPRQSRRSGKAGGEPEVTTRQARKTERTKRFHHLGRRAADPSPGDGDQSIVEGSESRKGRGREVEVVVCAGRALIPDGDGDDLVTLGDLDLLVANDVALPHVGTSNGVPQPHGKSSDVVAVRVSVTTGAKTDGKVCNLTILGDVGGTAQQTTTRRSGRCRR